MARDREAINDRLFVNKVVEVAPSRSTGLGGKMKLRSLWNWPPVAVMIPLLLVCPAVAQSAGGAASQGLLAQAPDLIQSGIVVEAVAKNSVAEKAGLRMGDVLLRWTRGATKGALETPFELSRTETE